MNTKPRGLKRFPIPSGLILELLRACTTSAPDLVGLPTFRGDLPEDAAMINVDFDYPRHSWMVTVASATWPDGPLGAEIPVVEQDAVFAFERSDRYRAKQFAKVSAIEEDRRRFERPATGGIVSASPYRVGPIDPVDLAEALTRNQRAFRRMVDNSRKAPVPPKDGLSIPGKGYQGARCSPNFTVDVDGPPMSGFVAWLQKNPPDGVLIRGQWNSPGFSTTLDVELQYRRPSAALMLEPGEWKQP